MRVLLRVLVRAVVVRFYAEYAGGLTVVGLLAFGILSNNEHRQLILAALASGRVLATVYLLSWTLYALISLRFAGRFWARPEHEVLRTLRLVPPGRRWLLGLLTQALILAPCGLYGAVMVAFAAQRHQPAPAAAIIGWLALLTTAGWAAHERALRGAPAPPFWQRGGWDRGLTPAFWFLREQVRTRLGSLLALKTASVAVIGGICAVYSPATFDVRLLGLGALLTLLGHALLAAGLYAFERARLSLLWNLPLGPGRRLARHALLFGALLLPELVAWLRWYPAPALARLGWALRLTALPLAGLLLVWAALLVRAAPPERMLRWVLPAGFGLYLLLLLRMPLAVLTLGLLTAAVGLTYRYYWRAEDPPLPAEN